MHAAKEAGVAHLQATPYALRHGGASHDMLTNRRSLAEAERRGRWRRDAFVRRYEKAAVTQRQLNLPDDMVAHANQVEANLAAIVLGNMPAPVPPRHITPAPPPLRGRARACSCKASFAPSKRGRAANNSS